MKTAKAKKKQPKTEESEMSVREVSQALKKLMGTGAPIPVVGAGRVVEFVGTGYAEIDRIFGGGVPRGRITEISGPEGGGKTSIALRVIANVQRAGGRAAFFDYERALHMPWAALHGVDLDTLWYSEKMKTGDELFDAAKLMAASGRFDVVVVDSAAAMQPASMLVEAGEKGDHSGSTMGAQARMFTRGLLDVVGPVSRSRMALIFLNQLRTNIGAWMNPETTPGGRAFKHYASIRASVRRMNKGRREGDEMVHGVVIKTSKNKLATPGQKAEVEVRYPATTDAERAVVEGSESDRELIDIAMERGLVKKGKSGGWFTVVEDNKMLHGVAAFSDYVTKTPEFADKLK